MISAFLLLAVTEQNQQPNLERDGGAIISKVFLKYDAAKTLAGTITQTISDGVGKKTITTLVSYQRPYKVYVQQDFLHPNGLKANLTSDGKIFVYDPPLKNKSKPYERLYEAVELPRRGTTKIEYLNVGKMYHAAHTSLAPTTLLDIAIAYNQHLKDFDIGVRTHDLVGVVDLDGKKAYHIKGLWQPYIGAPEPSAKYELWVSMEFDVLQYAFLEIYKVNGRDVPVTTVEKADLKIDVAVNQELFKVKLPK